MVFYVEDVGTCEDHEALTRQSVFAESRAEFSYSPSMNLRILTSVKVFR